MNLSQQTDGPFMICVADVDVRLACSSVCVACRHYMRNRRDQERRDIPRRTLDRRILSRMH